MVDNRVLIRQHYRGRGNWQREGGCGGRGGRLANHDRGLQPPSSPITNTISVHQEVLSSNDKTLNTFLEVIILKFINITVVLAHVKHARCGFISKLKTINLTLCVKE
jgi:hypothetical protein